MISHGTLYRLNRFARVAGGVVSLAGFVVLLGWLFNLPVLKSLVPGFPLMVPNTAMGFILAGSALCLCSVESAEIAKRSLVIAAAAVVALIGGITVVESLLRWRPGIDHLLFRASVLTLPGEVPGRPSILAAVNFLLLGLALLFLEVTPQRRWQVDLLILVPMQITILALVGYACNMPSYYGWKSLLPNTVMALNTAVTFVIFGAGLLCVRPERGLIQIVASQTAGSVVARRLLLAPALIPLLTGLVESAFRQAGYYNHEFAGWFFSFLNVFVFTVIIWWISVLLHRADSVRQEAERALIGAKDELEIRVRMRTVELAESNQRLASERNLLRTLIDSMPDVIFTKDLHGRFGVSNAAHVRFAGAASEAELRGKTAFDLYSQELATVYQRDDLEVITHNRPIFNREEPRVTREGRDMWLITTKVPLRNAAGEVVGLVGVSRDITERKYAELHAAIQHAVTGVLAGGASLQETAHDILEIICRRLEWNLGDLWTIDRTIRALRCVEIWYGPSGDFAEFATVSRKMTFAPGEGLPGRVWAAKDPMWIANVAQDGQFLRRQQAAALGLQGALAFPIKLRGAVFGVVEIFSTRSQEPTTETLALFAALGVQMGQFIERKQLEEQFRQAQKMEAVGTLAGGIAHDFNNVLTAITGFTEMANLAAGDNREVRECLQAVSVGTARAADLVRQIMSFSRQQEQQRTSIQLWRIVDEAVKLLRATIPTTVQFDISLVRQGPAVLADPTQVHQVIMNLVTNAVHAMKGRPGRLGLSLEEIAVDAALAALHPGLHPGHYFRLSVSDTGHGMDAATLSRIFDPFFTTKAPGEGTGLGLAVVHGIMQASEGIITVYSQPGEGTRFDLYFPSVAEATAEPTPQPPEVPRGCGQRILLVDDEPSLTQLGQKILERLGYAVECYTSPSAALAAVRANPGRCQLVITDLTMPEMTGTDLAAEILKIRPDMPIILATGYSASLTLAGAQALGFRDLLLKPLTLQMYGEAVQRVLGRSGEV